MKRLLPLLLLVIALSSCEKITDTVDNLYYFSAKVNGTSWETKEAAATTESDNGLTVILASGDDESYISLTFVNENTEATTIDVTSNSTSVVAVYYDGTTVFSSVSSLTSTSVGEIKITEITSLKIKGTFNFTAKSATGESVEITDGKFNILFVDAM